MVATLDGLDVAVSCCDLGTKPIETRAKEEGMSDDAGDHPRACPEIHLNNCLWSVPQIKSASCDCNRRISATAAGHWHPHEVRLAVAMRLKHTLRDLALPPSVSRSC